MSTMELKRYVDERTTEERRWLAAYLLELERHPDPAELTHFDRLMDEMDAGQKRVPWADARARLDRIDDEDK